jgi:hypothetical protein
MPVRRTSHPYAYITALTTDLVMPRDLASTLIPAFPSRLPPFPLTAAGDLRERAPAPVVDTVTDAELEGAYVTKLT